MTARLGLVVLGVVLAACGSGGGAGGGTGGGTGGGSAGGTGGGSGGGAVLPDPEVPVTGARENFMGTTFVVPAGLTESLATDAVVLNGPKATSQGSCAIYILPPRAAEADPKIQALNTVKAFFAPNFTDVLDVYGGNMPLDFVDRGVSGSGWDYIYFWGFLTDPAGQNTGSKVLILLAQLGANVVPMIGFEASDNLCLENDVTGNPATWALAFHSLDFATFTPSTRPGLTQQLLGKWKAVGSSYFIGHTYAANGHYAQVSAVQSYSTISSTEVLQTTSTWFGDGTWEAHGDRLTTIPNNGKPARTLLFRIEEQPNSTVAGGYLPQLSLIEISVVDNQPFEFSIRKDLN